MRASALLVRASALLVWASAGWCGTSKHEQLKLGNTLNVSFDIGWTQIYLFGFEIQSFEECMPKPETSGRYLSFGGEEAWSEVHT